MAGEVKALTGLRGLAVLFVLFSHVNKAGFMLFDGFDFSGSGRYGVFIFFVLSAYLLTRQFTEQARELNFLPHLISYLAKRLLRIYPLFILTLMVYYFFHRFGHTIWVFNAQDIVQNLLLLDGIGVFWAITVEFQYYFLIPLVSLLMLKYYDKIMMISFCSLAFLMLYGINFEAEFKSNLMPFLAIFYMGSFLAYLQGHFEKLKPLLNSDICEKYLGRLGLIILFLFIILVPKFYGFLVSRDISIGYFHHQFMLFGVLSSLLIFTSINTSGLLNKLLSSRLLCFIGKISFSMYLGHYIVIAAFFKYSHLLASSVSFMLIMLVTILLSYISFKVVEEPLYGLRQQIKVI